MAVRAWLRASRLASQSYLALPLLLGQLLAFAATGQWNWWVFLLVQAFGVFDQLYIVFANDVADEATDRDNATSTMFSGGSRVLVEGVITRAALLRAAGLMALAAAGCALLLGALFDRWEPLALAVLAIALLWAYSFPPLRLSYRGGGEFLQMLGLGLVLPLFGWVAQAGSVDGFPWALLGVLLPLNLAAAMATSLPDLPSDARAAKRTLVVRHGIGPARRFILVLAVGALALYGLWGHAAIAVDAPLWPLLALPLVALAVAVLLHRRAEPGSRALAVFVFLIILAHLAWLAGVSVALWLAAET